MTPPPNQSYGGKSNHPKGNQPPSKKATSFNKPRNNNNGPQPQKTLMDDVAKQYFSLCAKGSKIRIITITGDIWEAICHLCDSDSLSVFGKCITGKGKTQIPASSITEMGFHFKDIESYTILMECTPDAMKEEWKKVSGRNKFRTDTDISGTGGKKERVLQKWAPEDSDAKVNLSLEGASTKWDQFAVNEKLFGVTTDFNEDDYTTTIDRTDPEFAKREAEAARLAREIEMGPVDNVHIAEERGLAVPNDDTMDEEDKYSSVIRDTKPGKNVYQPPAKRGQPPQTRNAWAKAVPQQSSSASNAASASSTSSGTEVKNAWAKPLVTDKPKQPQQQSVPSTQSASQSQQKAPVSFAAKASAVPETSSQQKPIATKPFSAVAANANKPTNSTATGEKKDARGPIAATFANIVEKKTPHAQGNGNGPSKPPVVEEVAKIFKSYAVDEKKHLMQRKQIIMQMEKNVTINDFKKFSQDLKLKGPMPADLQEILHKNEKDEKVSSTSSQEKNTIATDTAKKPIDPAKPSPAAPETTQTTSSTAPIATGLKETVNKKPSSPGKQPKAPLAAPAITSTPAPQLLEPDTTSITGPASSSTAPPVVDIPDTVSEAGTVTSTTTAKSGFKLNVDAVEFTPGGFVPRGPTEKYNRPRKPGYQKGYKGYHKNGSPKHMGGYGHPYEDQYYGDYNMYGGYPPYPMQGYRPMGGRPPVMGPPGPMGYVPAPGYPPAFGYPPQQMMPPPQAGPGGPSGTIRPRGPPGPGSYQHPPPHQAMYPAGPGMMPYPPGTDMMGFQQHVMVGHPVPPGGWVPNPMDAPAGAIYHEGMDPHSGATGQGYEGMEHGSPTESHGGAPPSEVRTK